MAEDVEWALLRDLSDAARGRFLALGHRMRYDAGDPLVQEGEPADSMHLVESGRLSVRVTLESGAVATVNMLGPGAFFGELALLRHEPVRTATVTAVEPSTTLRIAGSEFRRLRRESPELTTTLASLLADRVDELSGRLLEALYVGLDERVRRRLIELCRLEDGTEPVRVRVTQQELAEMAGGTRVSVNQALQKLAASGVVSLSRGRIVVHDLARLDGAG